MSGIGGCLGARDRLANLILTPQTNTLLKPFLAKVLWYVMDLSIIIVDWKSADYLWLCLRGIQETLKTLRHDVIVIDNASYDGAEEMIRKEYPTVKFLQSSENLGFARANNLAFKASSGKSILFLNPDTEVLAVSPYHLQLGTGSGVAQEAIPEDEDVGDAGIILG